MPGIHSHCFIGGTKSEGQYFWVCPSGYIGLARKLHAYCYSSVGSGAIVYAGMGSTHLVSLLSLAPGQSREVDLRLVATVGESFFIHCANGGFGVHLSGFLLLDRGGPAADTLPADDQLPELPPPLWPSPKGEL